MIRSKTRCATISTAMLATLATLGTGLTGSCATGNDADDGLDGTLQAGATGPLANGVYSLTPANATGTRLDITGAGTKDGTNVEIWSSNGGTNQQYTFTDSGGGKYRISPVNAPSESLDVTGESTASGTNVEIWTDHGGANQRFTLTQVSGGFTLTPTHATGLRLTAVGSSSGANVDVETSSGKTSQVWNIVEIGSGSGSGSGSGGTETIGGGTLSSPAMGPAASFGLGGGFTLVKNWDFGTSGTIKSYNEMNAEFQYHSQFNGIGNDIGYGCVIAAPDSSHIAFSGAPVENVDTSSPVRQFTSDSLKTFLVPIKGVTTVDPSSSSFTCADGGFQAQFSAPNGGALLGHDLLWETRVRYVVPPYFWFAIWSSGNKWDQGAEMDLIESFGFDNGGGNTNFTGTQWHSDPVGGSGTTDYSSWPQGMASHGITSYDPTQYHTWTWLYRKDDSYTAYVDGTAVQSGTIHWTDGGSQGGTPINLDFIFDASWGNNRVSSVNHTLAASALSGKFYEWDYSRVYLR